jgi:hypothetical protein
MFRAARLAAGLALLAVLAGCGASDEDQAAQAVSAGLLEAQDGAFQFTQEQADCVGDGFVEEIGVEQLQEYGIITEDLEATDKPIEATMTGDDADGAGKVLVGCVDAPQLFKDAILRDADLSPEVESCIDDALTEELLTKFFSATFSEDRAAAAEATTPLQECLAE